MRSTLLACVVLAGCVPSRSTMFGPVERDLQRRLDLQVSWHGDGTDPRVPAAVAGLLAKPLTLDTALRIAMAHNRHLQAELEELGIAASSIAEATVLPPTEIDLSHKVALSGSGSETEITIVQDVLDLLQLGQRRGIAHAEVAAARARATAAAVGLALDVELAFDDVVAAGQERELRQTAFAAASASAELTDRMRAAGNTTVLALVRDREVREQARVDLARAEVMVEQRREALNAVLGLSGDDTGWTLAEPRLPEVPAAVPALDDLEQVAVGANLELVALGADAEAASGRVGRARFRALVPALGVGVAVAKRDEGDWEAGPAVRIGLPLFDQQQGPRARANAELRRARQELTATAVDLRAEARSARSVAREAHDEAVHIRTVILPLRNEILDQLVAQYNAMNANTFELLEAKRQLVDAGSQYIEALRAYWSAMARVKALQRGVLPRPRPAPESR